MGCGEKSGGGMRGANRALPVADEAGKSPQRRQWRMQQGDFEEVPRLAATIVAGNRLERVAAVKISSARR